MNAEVRQMKTAAELSLAQTYAAAKEKLPGASAMRESAFKRFESAGLPHRRIEDWKYTDLRKLMQDAKPLAAPPDAAAKEKAKAAGSYFASVDCRRLTFVDGAFVPEMSDLTPEAGVTIGSMSKALADGDPLVTGHVGKVIETDNVAVALNTALMGDGLVLHVTAGVKVARPILLVFAHSGRTPASVFSRSLMVVDAKASVTIVESHEACPDDQINAVVELVVGEDARVDHLKIAANQKGSLQVSTLIASVAARATFNDFICTTRGSVTRNQVFVRFSGEGIVANLRGISLLQGRQHADNTLVVEHVAPHCQSRELFKSVLDDESRAVFQGKIVVQQAAQKTDARMASNALLLSEDAEADNKPELEIFADDVQCGHGATAGALDDNLLFYLKARGIPAKEAEALMIAAFVGEAIEGVDHEGLRDVLLGIADRWLKARSA
jgi:Fe-S cluster assembly protein SufD